eukprot:scaffold57490_cov69-Phaeocystis_antarctica.AAC.1
METGHHGGLHQFTGSMWQALVSSKALSASEALQLHGTFAAGDNYCAASPPPSCQSHVLAYYHQGVQPLAGGVWPDLSQHGNDGTVSGIVSGAGDHVVFGN